MAVDGNILYILPFFLLIALAAIFWIWMLVECLTQESSEGNDKLAWTLVILLTNFIGAVIYFFVRRPSRIRMSSNQCVSRHWPLTIFVGLLLAITASGALLWLFPESSSVTAYLSVKALEPDSLFDDKQRINPKEYEIFQQTQLALFKSHFVLNEALARGEIAQLDAVVKEEPNALEWLSEKLKVSFPGEGEILEVRFDGEEDPEEIKKVVDAVITSYTNEVLHTETDSAPKRIRVMQSATASEKINKAERYFVASSVGLATLCLTCMGSVLIGCCANMPKKHANDEPR